METHSEIVKRLGIRRLAAELGHGNHTTVQGWAERSKIPFDHWPAVLQAAERIGEPLTLSNLMPEELRGAAA